MQEKIGKGKISIPYYTNKPHQKFAKDTFSLLKFFNPETFWGLLCFSLFLRLLRFNYLGYFQTIDLFFHLVYICDFLRKHCAYFLHSSEVAKSSIWVATFLVCVNSLTRRILNFILTPINLVVLWIYYKVLKIVISSDVII